MKLRLKTLLVVVAVMAAVFVVLFTSVQLVLRPEFAGLESRAAAVDAERARDALRESIRRLERASSDWATRNGTFEFMRGNRPLYTKDDLTEQGLTELGVNYMLFVDESGKLVHSETIDLDLGSRVKPDPAVERTLVEAAYLRRSGDPRGHVSGLVSVPGGIMMVSARSITTSDLYTAPVGTLVLARMVDAAEIERIGRVTKLNLDVFPLTNTKLPADVVTAMSELKTGARTFTGEMTDQLLGAYVLERDVNAAPALVLRAALPREIEWEGRSVMSYLVVSVVLAAGAATLAVFGLMDVSVLRRLRVLSSELAAIGRRHDPSARVSVHGRDEIAGVADDVNDMLRSIEYSEKELEGARDALEVLVNERTAELRASEGRYRGLIERMADGVFEIGSDGRIILANDRAKAITGLRESQLVGTLLTELLSPESAANVQQRLDAPGDRRSAWTMQVALQNSENAYVPIEMRVSYVLDEAGRPVGTQWIARDITERQRFEQELVHMANHDHLTGLYNRRFFETALEIELAQVRRSGKNGAILWLDLDNFKDINDSLGHRAGDEVLSAIAEQLRKHVRGANVLARLGGDEFGILIPGADLDEAEQAAERILGSLDAHTFSAEGQTVRVTASVGLVAYPLHGTTAQELLANADLAMYGAKEGGRGRINVHEADSARQDEMRTRVVWGERIASALRDSRFVVYAQPLLDLRTNEIPRYELLVRMLDDDGGLIPPSDFLPLAERIGLMRDIDRWMLKRAVDLLAGSRDSFGFDLNLSGQAFDDPDLLPLLEALLETAGVEPSRLGFEITETAAVTNIARAREFMGTLRHLGCRFSLDDFGSGFSSFYYLKHLPIDCLKVDGAFVRDLPQSKQDQHLVRGMVELARGLGIEVVAEYVESAEILQIVRDLDVDYAQGYHIAKPAPVEEVLGTAEIAAVCDVKADGGRE